MGGANQEEGTATLRQDNGMLALKGQFRKLQTTLDPNKTIITETWGELHNG
jgi:hypothetical protein